MCPTHCHATPLLPLKTACLAPPGLVSQNVNSFPIRHRGKHDASHTSILGSALPHLHWLLGLPGRSVHEAAVHLSHHVAPKLLCVPKAAQVGVVCREPRLSESMHVGGTVRICTGCLHCLAGAPWRAGRGACSMSAEGSWQQERQVVVSSVQGGQPEHEPGQACHQNSGAGAAESS